ncbi:unnamed protein product [Ostreobium quekettii]|uniref:Protein kinase domain-containing protein n=1 Tax=Ostreobium quekettii TaxID=121088 RepID=A0A8S1IU62_9CHLO|nr:unnamed protein product [Ostreobium quekettii]
MLAGACLWACVALAAGGGDPIPVSSRPFIDDCDSIETTGLRKFVRNLEVDTSSPELHDMDGARFKRRNAQDGMVRYDSLHGFTRVGVTGFVHGEMDEENWELLLGTVGGSTGVDPVVVLNSTNLGEYRKDVGDGEGEGAGWVKFEVGMTDLVEDCPRSVQLEMRGSAIAEGKEGWGLQLGTVELVESGSPMCASPECLPAQQFLDRCKEMEEARQGREVQAMRDDAGSIAANAYGVSPNLVVDSSNASRLFTGYGGRFTRADGKPARLTYFVPDGILSVSLAVFACGGAAGLNVTPYSDPDCKSFSLQPVFENDGSESDGCWRRRSATLDFGDAQCLPSFVDIDIDGGEGWELQLSEVAVRGYGVAENGEGQAALAETRDAEAPELGAQAEGDGVGDGSSGRGVIKKLFPVLLLAACLGAIVGVILMVRTARVCCGVDLSPSALGCAINPCCGGGTTDTESGKPSSATFDRLSTYPSASPRGKSLSPRRGYVAPEAPSGDKGASAISISFSNEAKGKKEQPSKLGHRRGASFFEQAIRDIQRTFMAAKKPAPKMREGELVTEVQTFTCDVRARPADEGPEKDVEADGGKPWVPWADFKGQPRKANFLAGGGASPRMEVRLVMEFCDAGSLRDALRDRRFMDESGKLVFEHVLLTALDIARGMRCLHLRSVIHGDLKPDNVLLKSANSDGRNFIAKIADFGMSIPVGQSVSQVEMNRGTGGYISPEVASRQRIYPSSDVYTFGIMMWELYASKTIREAAKEASVQKSLTIGRWRPSFPVGCPRSYAKLAAECWNEYPDWRPSFDQIVKQLTGMLNTPAPSK